MSAPQRRGRAGSDLGADREAEHDADARRAVRASMSVAGWTVISRATGFVRAATLAAVLGATYLGNTYQLTNLLPSLVFEFLTGSLFASLLVPSLVGWVDRGDRRSVERIAGGFLGMCLIGFTALVAVAMLARGPILDLFALGVDDPAVAADQRQVGALLLAMLMPQVVLYGVAGVAGAVLNAHGRFALPAAAPALENVGVIVTLLATAVIFGSGATLDSVEDAELLVLGLGTTAAVGVHAVLLWWGAWRVGARLVPRLNFRDPDVREVLQKVRPSLGYSGLNAVRHFGVLVVANSVSGGVVAFNLAMNFFYLPVAVGARPVAVALLPQLSRLRTSGAMARFRDEAVRGAALAGLVAVPSAVAYLGLAQPLADAASFGQMGTPSGSRLVAVSLAALAVGVLGEAGFVIATQVFYALNDARTPFGGMVVRSGVSLVGMLAALLLLDGTAVLVALGLAISAGNLASLGFLLATLARDLPRGSARLRPPLLRTLAASGVMIGPAYLVAGGVSARLAGEASDVVGMLAAAVAGATIFLALQRAWHSAELNLFVKNVWNR